MDRCVFCGLTTYIRKHHIVPRSKGGKITVFSCETCENFIHKTWNHNELRDIYNTVESILRTETFQKFLKWRVKQPPTVLFKSCRNKFRDRHKYR
jgi:hypothetical protein